MRKILCAIVVAGFLCLGARAHAADDDSQVSLLRTNPFSDILENTAHAFTGWNLALQLAGVASAPIIITSGADTDVHNFMVEHHHLGVASAPAVYGGYVATFLIGGSLMTWGVTQHSQRALAASSAVLQAGLLMLVYQSVLKSVTGRPHPEPVRYDDDSASSTFRFGFLRGGVHYGWPSGHLMISTSMFASLLRVYPDSLWLRVGGSVLLGYVAYAVVTHESNSMHWLSDMVSGTLMGAAIGNAVGAGFAKRLGPDSAKAPNYAVTPMLSGQTRGVSLWFRF